MEHITFDLETLGNTTTAPIIQIAAVKFNTNGDIIDKFSRNIKWESLSKYSFNVDYSTINWWFNQEDKAIKSVANQEGAINLKKALLEFKEWVKEPKKYYYWSHATFDPPILSYNIKQVGLADFIPFRLQRDIRTLVHLKGKASVEREGIAHNALDDAIFQSKYISQLLKL